jgi:hypothetical protein
MQCSYCSKILSNEYNLIRHQKTSKSCISMQNGQIETKLTECEYCRKKLTSSHSLAYHKNICKKSPTYTCLYEKNKIELIEQIKEHKATTEELLKKQTADEKQKKRIEWELERHKQHIEEDVELKIQELSYTVRQQQEQYEYELKKQAEKQLAEKEIQEEQLKQLQDELRRLKEQQLVPHSSTATHNGNNVTTQMENNVSQCQNTDSFNKTFNISITNYLTEERVTKAFESYNINTLLGSQKEFANFTIDNFLLGENTPVYLCTDRSRKKFFFTDTDGKFIEDANCATLISYIMKHGIPKIREVCMEELENVPVGVTEEAIHTKYNSVCAIGKDGAEYQSQLGKRLPATVDDKKRLDDLQEQDIALPEIPKEDVVVLTEEQEKAQVEHEAYMMYTNVGGVPLFRLNKYRTHFRTTGEVQIPAVLDHIKEQPVLMERYHLFLRSRDTDRIPAV